MGSLAVAASTPIAGSGAAVTRMSLRDALELGPEIWDPLLALSESASPFSGWAWHHAWSLAAEPRQVDAREVLLVRGPDGAPQAILPLALSRIRWRRMLTPALTWATGDDGCPDHLDLLAAPGADLDALAAAVEALPWHVAVFENVADPSPNLDRLSQALGRRGLAVRRAPLWACPRLALPDSWETYLASLSSGRRQALRRKERGLYRDHAATLTDYSPERLEEGFGHLVRLHQERWGGAGAFVDPRAARLQLEFAREMAKRRRLWLTTLDCQGEPAAAWYGFSSHDSVYFYQSGRALRWENESVGQVLMGIMIRRAIEQGYRWFDFLRGEDPYKTHWTGARRSTRELVVFRSGWRGGWLRALDFLAEHRLHA